MPEYEDYDERQKAARKTARYLSRFMKLKGKRVLEIGPHLADLSIVLARDYGCEVVGIDPLTHPNWPDVQREYPQVRLIEGDIAFPPTDLEDESFDLIVSFVVFEHIRHPWTALKECQRMLKPSGHHFIRANLYRSSIGSHLYGHIEEPWLHLMYSPDEIAKKFSRPLPGWAFWVNKLTYQQYLFYFRQLGMFVTHERFWQVHFDAEYYDNNEKRLGLYPQWDLKTDFFEVILEFDQTRLRVPIEDPVYRIKHRPVATEGRNAKRRPANRKDKAQKVRSWEYFDQDGRAAFYVTENGRVYQWNGAPIGTVENKQIHNCEGRFIGWIISGYIVNRQGKRCFFSDEANDARATPQDLPHRKRKQPLPMLLPKEPVPPTPIVQDEWGDNPFRRTIGDRIKRAVMPAAQIVRSKLKR